MNAETCRIRAAEFLEFGRNHPDLAFRSVGIARGFLDAAAQIEAGALACRRGEREAERE